MTTLDDLDATRDAAAEDFPCHCSALIGEPCVTSGELAGCCHEARHRKADAANWRALARVLNISAGWTVGRV